MAQSLFDIGFKRKIVESSTNEHGACSGHDQTLSDAARSVTPTTAKQRRREVEKDLAHVRAEAAERVEQAQRAVEKAQASAKEADDALLSQLECPVWSAVSATEVPPKPLRARMAS